MAQGIAIEQEYKTFTVRQIFEALEKNGVDHLRGEWISTNGKGKVVGACALGQAALNMSVLATADYDNSDDLEDNGNLYDELTNFEISPDNKWYVEGNEDVASTIVFWNDMIATDKYGNALKDKNGRVKYALRYWYQVVGMAREVMLPHFDKEVKLPHYNY